MYTVISHSPVAPTHIVERYTLIFLTSAPSERQQLEHFNSEVYVYHIVHTVTIIYTVQTYGIAKPTEQHCDKATDFCQPANF